METIRRFLTPVPASSGSTQVTSRRTGSRQVSAASVNAFLNDKENGQENGQENEEEETSRLSKFATCVRSVSATVPFKKRHMFNDSTFNEAELRALLPSMSSKFNTLLETIQRADAEDMATHGKLFKHFIFTDLRKGAVGAKAIASFLQVNGFDNVLKAETGFRRRRVLDADKKPVLDEAGKPTYRMERTKKLKVTLAAIAPTAGGSNRMGLLQSSPLWKSQLGVDIRKKMLSIFNGRPDNIHGEQIRIMILDSKFKEGIDLYDVKYVHLMEPAITEADLKQAVGRATRFCGQRGLQFVPNVGWKLKVFLYETEFASGFPFSEDASEELRIDAHTYMMAHSGLDLGLLEMTRQLTVLGIRSAVDYDLTYKINNFKIATQIHNLTELQEAVVVEVNPQTGGAVSVLRSVKDLDRTKCGRRANKFFPFTVKDMRAAMRDAGIPVPANADREWFCKHVTDGVVQRLLAIQKARLEALPKGKDTAKTLTTVTPMPTATAKSTASYQVPAVPPPSAVSTIASNSDSVRIQVPNSPYQVLFPVPEKPERLSAAEIAEMPDVGAFFAAAEARVALEKAADLSFAEFQRWVSDTYGRFAWDSPVVKSACEFAPPVGQPVQFSRSQDFVRHYLTPTSPHKGLLAWHSVGTGKTCTAVATATTTFEKEGYSILWVTRNSLMADVWKNMFGAVCSVPIQEHLAAGKKLPSRLGTQKRLVSKLWFDPISYKTLQNALVPVKKGARKGAINKLGRVLRERNGTVDPLRRTFLIIDEVHKLLDGDLKTSEQADFAEIARMIQASYDKSGVDSCKVLLMTATPITDDPKGLFDLLNLLIDRPAAKFPPIEDFRAKYTTAEGQITEAGEHFFQERAKGLISYLNREFDPSAFAQPEFVKVRVAATGAVNPTDEELLRRCWEAQADTDGDDVELECDVDALKADMSEELEAIDADEDVPKKEKAGRKRTLKADYKARIDACNVAKRTRKQRVKERVRRMGLCVAEAAKTRKRLYTKSQQKAVASCFKKGTSQTKKGEPVKFTGIAELKRGAKSYRPGLVQRNIRSYLETRKVAKASKESKRSKREGRGSVGSRTSVRAVRLTSADLAELAQE